jgi:hypothetical protein
LSQNGAILIISSTKGNISLPESETPGKGSKKELRQPLFKPVADHFHFVNQPSLFQMHVSGVLAIITGMRMINRGNAKCVIAEPMLFQNLFYPVFVLQRFMRVCKTI